MKVKTMLGMTVAALALGAIFVTNAYAAAVNVKCEVRGNRSKVSVDGSGLQLGRYIARVTSGGATITSAAQNADPVTREAEFDFDSNPNDIAAGATAIARNFIKNNAVVGSIVTASGTTVASASAVCRAK